MLQVAQPVIPQDGVGGVGVDPHEVPEFWGANPPLQVKQVAIPAFTLHVAQLVIN